MNRYLVLGWEGDALIWFEHSTWDNDEAVLAYAEGRARPLDDGQVLEIHRRDDHTRSWVYVKTVR